MRQKVHKAYGESLPEKTERAVFIVTDNVGPMCSSSVQVDDLIHPISKRRTNKAQPEGSRVMYDPPVCRDKVHQWCVKVCRCEFLCTFLSTKQ